MSLRTEKPRLEAGLLLRAYANGWFPMAHEDGEIYWHDPDPRAVFELHHLRMGRSTRKQLVQEGFTLTHDRCFTEVMRACADRPETWITEEMIAAYTDLHKAGRAHSVETWLGDELVGGIYGVALGAAFFGESMFSRVSGAGKAAFFHLSGHLREQGFVLFDTQYRNPFTKQLGAVEIARADFQAQLAAALSLPVTF
ncbi:MAG: leucyl/phenylalanyl-tRNA--protein transferase [Flavobacteriales bacterium]|nr:leucyl/phenylalanyl-tRNA--protein transferase [Flavobacteriales bacterium]